MTRPSAVDLDHAHKLGSEHFAACMEGAIPLERPQDPPRDPFVRGRYVLQPALGRSPTAEECEAFTRGWRQAWAAQAARQLEREGR